MRIPVQSLGQSGYKLSFPDCNVYIDPYLSNSVQELDAVDLERQIPIPILPNLVNDANLVLITHEHIDHCDPFTIPKIAEASPRSRFIGPIGVTRKLEEWGIDSSRILLATESWVDLGGNLRFLGLAAAHPEIQRDSDGRLRCMGYILEWCGRRIYIAGDTCVHQEIIDTLLNVGSIHTAFLPVNERNFFRDRRGIVGNMSIREAYLFAEEIGVKHVVAVHWDMFAINSASPEEIRLIHHDIKAKFSLSINPSALSLNNVRYSFIIRTLNEGRYLGSLLQSISEQEYFGFEYEVIIVDSGSTDNTLEIARNYKCQILHIDRNDFSFGRSLNMGSNAAIGDILIFISGHCIPASKEWLYKLCEPIVDGHASYAYGRQLGGMGTQFSEAQIFSKFYPESSNPLREPFFCNNANAAISREIWNRFRFDENLTGLEDMEIAQRIVGDGRVVIYVPEAAVFHHHNETWAQVRRRFEREALALQKIMPQLHVGFFDTVKYFCASVYKDLVSCLQRGVACANLRHIFLYRWNQYLGSYLGNRSHRMLSKEDKDRYFFP